jgi:hypothetical protein
MERARGSAHEALGNSGQGLQKKSAKRQVAMDTFGDLNYSPPQFVRFRQVRIPDGETEVGRDRTGTEAGIRARTSFDAPPFAYRSHLSSARRLREGIPSKTSPHLDAHPRRAPSPHPCRSYRYGTRTGPAGRPTFGPFQRWRRPNGRGVPSRDGGPVHRASTGYGSPGATLET